MYNSPQYPGDPNLQYNQPQYGQPQYFAPPQPMPPPVPQGPAPTVITINYNNNDSGDMCPHCCNNTPTYERRACGAGNFLYCILCFSFFGPFSLIFLCSEDAMDLEFRCTRCQGLKRVVSGACE